MEGLTQLAAEPWELKQPRTTLQGRQLGPRLEREPANLAADVAGEEEQPLSSQTAGRWE